MSGIRVRLTGAALLAFALGCASESVAPDATAAPAPEPSSLAAMQAREAAPQPTQEIAAEDGAFRTRAAGTLVEPRSEDGSHFFGIDIGSEAPVHCSLHPGELDLASTLLSFSASTFGVLAERHGEIAESRIAHIDAGAIGASPFLRVDWLYGVEQEGETRYGQFKHFVATKRAHTLYCLHNEVGYGQSFQRVVAGVVESLDFAVSPEPAPEYEEIRVIAVRGQALGVERLALRHEAADQIRIERRTSMLVPGENALAASDHYGVELTGPDGTLHKQRYVEVENGALVSAVDLQPAEGGWALRGRYRGAPLEARLPADSRVPASWLGTALALRRAIEARGVGAEIQLARWVPGVDATRLLDETISIRERVDGDRFRGQQVVGGAAFEIVLDRSGSEASGSAGSGDTERRSERIFAAGQF